MATHCPKCNAENPDTQNFCGDCGTQLTPPKDIPAQTRTIEIPAQELTRGTLFAGRYNVIEKLGMGGMGAVYRVEDTKIHEDVALKLIRPEIAAEKKTIERFGNELRVARKISHKNVCRMYHLEEHDGTHFITMEYVPGEDLKSFIRRSKKLAVEKVLSIAEQICEGLTAAHNLGIVHRDLKPGNIMIDRDGNAHVMDFGIARIVEKEKMIETTNMIGTPAYMSPEQVEGQEVDLRSDIYSLGVILYEMVAGRLPFKGETAFKVAVMHKTQVPTDPRELNPQVPKNLSRIILKCMEKERDKRYQKIEDLLSELRISTAERSEISEPELTQLPAFLVSSEDEKIEEDKPIFVARKKELGKLNKSLDKMMSGLGQVAFVIGEAGDGKTALIEEFARQAQEAHPNLIVASGKCNAHTGIGEPYLPFREILGLLTGDVEPKWEAGAITREHASRLWNFLPFSARALIESGPDLLNAFISGDSLVSRVEACAATETDLLGKLKRVVEHKRTATPDPSLQQIVFFNQFTGVIQSLARENPLLFILDDLQWSDAGSVSLLFHLGRRIKGSQIMIVGAYRFVEVASGRGEERHPLEPVVNEFKRDFGDIEVEVGKDEGQTFVDALIDAEPNRLSAEFRDDLFRLTKGHPLFTVELMRDMQEKGLLLRDEDGLWKEEPRLSWEQLPARVEAAIGERIGRLPEGLREVLTIASVEGEDFTAEVCARLRKVHIRDLIRQLSTELDKKHHLVSAKGILRADNQRLSLYQFQHILFQRYLYTSLDEVERAHLHDEIGNILETLYGDKRGEIAGQLARHFQEAGDPEKAIEYLRMAGDKAARLHANIEALGYYARVLEQCQKLGGQALKTAFEVARSRAYVNIIIANMSGAFSDFEFMLDAARQLGDSHLEGLALAFQGMGCYYTHEVQKGEEILRRALAIAEEGYDDVRLLASSWLGSLYQEIGRHAESRELYQKLASEAEPKVDDPIIRIGTTVLFWHPLYEYDLDKALELNTRTRKDAERCGFPTMFLAHQFGEALIRGCMGEYERTLKLLDDIHNTCRRMGENWVKVRHYNTVGWIYGELQNHNKALEWNSRGVKEAQEAHFPNPECESNARLNVGDNLMELGHLEEAEGQFLWVEKIVRERKPEHLFMLWKYSQHLFHSYGEFWLIKGDLDKALSYANECLTLAEESNSKKYIVKARRLRGQVFMEEGKLEEAEKELLLAVEVARTVGNPTQLWLSQEALGDLRQLQGRTEDSLNDYRDAYSVIEEEANSLSDETLKQTFLDSPRVQKIQTNLKK